ncbi:sulfite exporter TauE/SafE family protein [Bacillus methanolicus]|uniref:Cytochrome c biogenesis protein transmembrane protein n=1 Tax=Bacillus methanolicus (strain MGA3 / ATCC 53907) TaxID=796606 RepID=I3DTL0_BACMM|nr:sulfite exporter TauE/SafE family protein [Bacillus methanolicus]AIE61773.1 cytochrome c biogenesis protein transmembrane protein [Bacillus methanolicus MGA3]EIJ77581.1 cytochrome c biogenesis protein transmembrane region [Bacillus methanolicus MGA3]
MYSFLSQISNFLSQPFLNIAHNTTTIPILSAFVLGIVGAMAPCQITGNLGAITLYSNQSLQKGIAWKELLLFIFGKIIAFSGLGLIVWLMGKEIQSTLTLYFPWLRKLIGPILILVGLYLLGLFKMYWNVTLFKIPERFLKKGKTGSFLMGFGFSLAFCPTMFVLFFVTLMPLVYSTSYGVLLPSIFAIGTSVPVIFFILILWYLGFSGSLMKKGKQAGRFVQKAAGMMMVLLGILDTITYWF